MSIANQHSRTSVQRLRREEIATSIPGSQGQDPRTLRPERLKWLSIPFPAKSHRRKASERGRGCWMGSTDPAKNEPAAQIAAFPNTRRKPSVSRRKATAVCRQTAIALPCGPKWKHQRQPSYNPHVEVPTQWASKHGPVAGRFTLRGCFAAPQGEGLDTSTRRAFAHHISNLLLDGRKGQSLAGTDPSTFLSPGVT
mgnify:CR=1 FL=1